MTIRPLEQESQKVSLNLTQAKEQYEQLKQRKQALFKRALYTMAVMFPSMLSLVVCCYLKEENMAESKSAESLLLAGIGVSTCITLICAGIILRIAAQGNQINIDMMQLGLDTVENL